MNRDDQEEVVPLVEERVFARKQEVETGRVRVKTFTDETVSCIKEDLMRDEVEVRRVTIDREVDHIPEVREEDGVIIIPVVEEVVIVEKRLILREEVHVHRKTSIEPFEQKVTIRSQHPVVERESLDEVSPLPK